MQVTTNSQRGIRLINLLLFEDQPGTPTPKKQSNGRDPDLIEARDNFLLHRVFFKTKIERKNYEDTFKELKDEVWLSKMQIQKIIQAKGDELLALKRQQPSINDLRRMWPHIKW